MASLFFKQHAALFEYGNYSEHLSEIGQLRTAVLPAARKFPHYEIPARKQESLPPDGKLTKEPTVPPGAEKVTASAQMMIPEPTEPLHCADPATPSSQRIATTQMQILMEPQLQGAHGQEVSKRRLRRDGREQQRRERLQAAGRVTLGGGGMAKPQAPPVVNLLRRGLCDLKVKRSPSHLNKISAQCKLVEEVYKDESAETIIPATIMSPTPFEAEPDQRWFLLEPEAKIAHVNDNKPRRVIAGQSLFCSNPLSKEAPRTTRHKVMDMCESLMPASYGRATGYEHDLPFAVRRRLEAFNQIGRRRAELRTLIQREEREFQQRLALQQGLSAGNLTSPVSYYVGSPAKRR